MQGQMNQKQGIGVDMNYVLEEYSNHVNALNKEVIFLKAYIKQLEDKIQKLESEEEVKENGTN